MDGCRERKSEAAFAALSPDFPPACSETSSFNLFFSRILQRDDRSWRITTKQAYQLASMTLMTRESESLESSNVASLFYSNDRLKNEPAGCNGVFLLMGTNGNLLKHEEMSTVNVISPNIFSFFFLAHHQMRVLLMRSTSVDIKGIKFHGKLESTYQIMSRCF